MIELIISLYDLFFSPLVEGVNIAIAPLAAVGIGLGAQVAGQGISRLLSGPDRRRAKRRERESRRDRNRAFSDYDESIDAISERAEGADDLATQTEEEVFGAERERQTQEVSDTIAGQLASGQKAVSRSLMATGGDVSGTGATTLQRLQEGASSSLARALSGINENISRRFEQRRSFNQRRADSLTSGAASGRSGIFSATENRSLGAERNRLLQRQAERQLGADIGSSVADFGAQLI